MTQTPTTFLGTPVLTDEVVENIRELYLSTLGDSNTAAEGFDLGWYTGQAAAFEDVLRMLYGMPTTDEEAEDWKAQLAQANAARKANGLLPMTLAELQYEESPPR